jgi:branched-chain amino acid transport system substrate-binding protein
MEEGIMRKLFIGKFMLLAAAAALMMVSAGPAAAADTIKIGLAAPLTGDAAAYGDNIKAGAELKLEEINAAGGINGKKLELVEGDDLCDPKEAGTVGSRFAANKNIVAVLGHVCSSAHLAALPIYVRVGLPAISATATNVTIGEVGKGWSFRTCYTDDYQGQFLARYVKSVLGLDKVGVFYENNDYGIGLKDSFVDEADKVGLEVVATEAYNKGATDFGPQLTKLLALDPEGIFLCGYYQEGGLIANQARKKGFEGPLFGADGIDNQQYLEVGGQGAENTFVTVPFLADVAGPKAQEFVAKFKEKTDRDSDWMSANAYDALGILAAAIEEAGADRKGIRDAMAAMDSVDTGYKGATGVTFFDEKGDCIKNAFVKKVEDGEFVPAEQMK